MGLMRLYITIVIAIGHLSTYFHLPVLSMVWSGGLIGIARVHIYFLQSGFFTQLQFRRCLPEGGGITGYYRQRAWRIYPQYLFFTLLMLCTYLAFGDASYLRAMTQKGVMPTEMLLANALALDLPLLEFWNMQPHKASGYLLLPQAWSLTLQFGFILLAPFVLSSRRRLLIVTMLCTVSMLYYYAATPLKRNFFVTELAYYWFGAWVAQGAGIIGDRLRGKRLLWMGAALILPTLGMVLWSASLQNAMGQWPAFALINAFLAASMIPAYFLSRGAAWDKFFANMSYSLYLCHEIIAYIALRLAPGHVSGLLVLGLSLCVAAIINLPAARHMCAPLWCRTGQAAAFASKRFILLPVCIGLIIAAARFPADHRRPDALAFLLAQYPFPVTVAPDGKQVLYKTRHEHDFEMNVTDAATGKVLAASRADETQLALSWSPDGRYIAFLASSKDASGRFMPYLWDWRGNRILAIAGVTTETASVLPRWRPGAKALAMYDGNGYRGRIAVIDLKDDILRPAVQYTQAARPGAMFAWSPDGNTLAYVPAGAPESIALLRPEEGISSVRMIHAAGPGAAINDISWSPDAGRIALGLLLPHSEYASLSVIGAQDAKELFHLSPEGDISEPFWHGASGSVLFSLGRDGMQQLWSANPATGDRPAIATRDSHHILGAAADGEHVYDYVTHLDSPPEIDALAPGSGKAVPLARSPLRDGRYVAPQFLTLKASDGSPVPVYLWPGRASAPGRHAALLWVPGGPDMQFLPVWDARIQWLVAHGITVAAVNYRGSKGYGASFNRQADLAKEALDVLAVSDYLANTLRIPAKDIILNGYSKGSVLAMKALALKPDGFGAAVLVSSLPAMQPYCAAASSLHGIYGFHGEFDHISPVSAAHESFTRCFAKAHWQVFGGEGHNFHQSDSWSAILEAIAEAASHQ